MALCLSFIYATSKLLKSFMFKDLVLIVIAIFLCNSISAQFEMGVKFGINSTQLASDSIDFVTTNQDQIKLAIQDSDYGVHIGLYMRFSLAGLYIEPAGFVNSSKVTYKLSEIQDSEIITSLKNESFTSFDIPVLVGYKIGFFRIQGGGVAHLVIDTVSDLIDIKGYEGKFKTATYGYQAGIGLDAWKIRIDLNYEGNLSKFGDHITIDDTPYSFNNSAARFILNAGFRF